MKQKDGRVGRLTSISAAFQLEETVALAQRIEKVGVAAIAVHGR